MKAHIVRKILLALALAALLAGCASSQAPLAAAPAATPGALPNFKHVFIIVLENKEYEQVVGSDQAPYLNDLAGRYALAENYYGIRHPSLPNYLALTGGSTFGITSDCTDCVVSAPSIADQIEQRGKTWKAYIESLPSPCFVGDQPPLYRQKHNPFIYYSGIRDNPRRCANIVPFTQFAADAAANALPDYVWITPNMCNDAHDCPISSADNWLKNVVPAIQNTSAWKDGGALFITFDEGSSKKWGAGSCCQEGNGGRIATLVISPLGRPGYRSPVAYDHYSLLRTIEDAWGMPELGGAACACAPPLADLFVTQGAAPR